MADFNRYITALETVSRAMTQLGLVTTVPTAAYGSSDPTVVQVWNLMCQAGLEVLEDHDWQFLQKTHTITTVPAQTEYALPDDFSGFYEDSAWNMTNQLPAFGSVTPQIWRMLQARNMGNSTFVLQYIIQDDNIVLYNSPSTAQSLTFEYKGRGWVRKNTDANQYRDTPSNDADVIMFNPNMFVCKVKLAFRKAKGFDSTAAQNDYNAALALAKGRDKSGMTLSTARSGRFPYLGYYNMPDTGYGS